MAHVDYEQELFGEGEMEGELEFESEFESEAESENEQFFGEIAQWGKDQWSALNTPGSPQRRIAIDVAKTGLKTGLGALGTALGGRVGAGGVGGAIGSTLGEGLGNLLPDREYEFEAEGEGEVSAGARPHIEAAMEYLGKAAAEAETDEEANAYLSALAPLAAQLVPSISSHLLRSSTGLIPETISMARLLRQNGMRPLIRTLPTALGATTADLARKRSASGGFSPQTAVRSFAQNAHKIISNPRASHQAYRRSQNILKQNGVGVRGRVARPARPQQRRTRSGYGY